MKIRIFTNLKNGVYHARIHTEDWSENDRALMRKYSEPEINLGGSFNYSDVQNWGDWSGAFDPSAAIKSTKKSTGSSELTFTDTGFKLDDNYARIMTESPFTQKFDIRNFELDDAAYEDADRWAQGTAYTWTRIIRDRIFQAVYNLRYNSEVFNSKEEIFDFSSYNNDGGIVHE